MFYEEIITFLTSKGLSELVSQGLATLIIVASISLVVIVINFITKKIRLKFIFSPFCFLLLTFAGCKNNNSELTNAEKQNIDIQISELVMESERLLRGSDRPYLF